MKIFRKSISKRIFFCAVLSGLMYTSPVQADFNEDNILGTTTVERDEQGNIKTIITVKNRTVESYSSNDTATSNNYDMTATLNATFLNDKYSNNLTTILSLNGFIPSGRKFSFPSNNSWLGSMLWPEQYSIKVMSESLDKPVKITDSTPTNTIRSKEVSDSITYGIGGGVKIEGKTPGVAADVNAAFTKTISYQQPDYETTKVKGTISESLWNTSFTETIDGYNRTSWNPVYGNQMFMYGRYTSNIKNNFTPDYQLSPLIRGGFSPSYGIVMRGSKDVQKSRVKVIFMRTSETYEQSWSGFNWVGRNFLNQSTSDWYASSTFLFEIDWQNHNVKFIA